jgi:Tol biopolymer transport system component
MNADGSGVTRLTNDPAKDMRPAWCGTRIAFQSDRILAPYYDVFVMNDDGTGATRLTIRNGSSDEYPTWSPSCDRVAYAYDPDGTGAAIRVINADGSDDHTLLGGAGQNNAPAWSPDGTRIAFTSRRDADQPPVRLEIREIYVMNADGSGQTRLTHTDVNAWNVEPVWSSDGTQIAFASNRGGHYAIYVMNADGGGMTQVADSAVANRPAWFGAGRP